ncbi:MAG TPA: PSD1 and planctomycete cytochrome C domain-containing protein [Humisphaera sp.]
MTRFRPLALFAFALPALASVPALAAPAATPAKDAAAGIDFFERKVRPVLVQNCYQCHATTSQKLKANLYCDSRAGLLKGGDSGPAIVPGNSAKSALIKAIRSDDPDTKMPPKQALSAQQVADLAKWVDMGAPWPAEPKVAAKPGQTQAQRWAQLAREHWAWQPVKAVAAPAVKDAAWAKGDIDKFVLAKLDAAGLKPVADADKVTLIRRVTFDLVGLPPTPEEVTAFVNDPAPDAYERLVDRLLASPAFGEKWGRHWLDVARYAESTGSSRNYPYHHAWRYRDYVIDSFNADKPYNVFVQEQIAGDLMPSKDATQRNERLVATGLLAMGVKDLNERNAAKYDMDNVDEQIDVVSKSVLATTVACARCHDHKFDPIPTEDYYKLAGIFKSSEILSGVKSRKGGNKEYADPASLVRLTAVAAPAAPAAAAKPAAAPQDKAARIAAATAKLESIQTEMRKMRADLGLDAGDKANAKALAKKNPAKAEAFLAKRQELQQARAELAELESAAAPAPAAKKAAAGPDLLAMGIRDDAKPADCRINIHGEHDDLGPAVPRGVVSLIRGPAVPTIKPDESGRLQLAYWLSSPQNPLTSRVMANRVWQHLFGEGLVRTVDNFGTTGETPSHPELLDHLATQFVRDGWSVKRLVRSVVLSHTYRLASTYDPKSFNADPENRLLWRHGQRRLDAEQIRDAMLVVGGNLETSRPAASPVARLPDAEIRQGRRGADFDRTGGEHRSVYLPVVRAMTVPMMDTFDVAEPTMVTGARDVTTVATQALFMMNNEFAVAQARRLAERVRDDVSSGTDEQRVDRAYAIALGRGATAAERARGVAYVNAFAAEAGTADKAKARADGWAAFCQALVASAEFRYLN